MKAVLRLVFVALCRLRHRLHEFDQLIADLSETVHRRMRIRGTRKDAKLITIEDIRTRIIEAFDNPNRFKHAQGLLEAYCRVVAESKQSWAELRSLRIGSAEFNKAFERQIAYTDQMIELADLLRLWPGEEDEPILRPN